MRKTKQLSLFRATRKNTKLWWIQERHVYGGSFNYRKVARPFDGKKLTHAVFKAQIGSAFRFTRSHESIRKLLYRVADAYEIKIKDLAINHDHIHVLFDAMSEKLQTNFLRLFAAEMGRKYKGIFKKFGVKWKGSMWSQRPFTRLVSWGKRSLQNVTNYFRKNRDEAMGFVDYAPRAHRLDQFLREWNARALTTS